MITTVVQFRLAAPLSLDDARRRFESSAPKYRNLPGLIRKYYIRAEDGLTAGGVYLWDSREAAEQAYNEDWRAFVEKLYGSAPLISWFDSPVVVDNTQGGAITTAA